MHFEVIFRSKLSNALFATNRAVRFSCPHSFVRRSVYSILVKREKLNSQLLCCNLNADFVNSFSADNKSLIKYAINLFKKYERLFNERKDKVPPEGSEKQNEQPPQPPVPNSLIAIMLILSILMFFYAGSDKNDFDVPTVSWSEFQHQMLGKGEVESVTVFPGANVALVRVHDGAIIRGRPSFHKVFKLSIINMDHFEQRLREAESALGISPENSIPVIYNRSLNEVSQLLTLVFLISLLALLAMRTRVSISSNDIFGRFNQMSRAKFTVVDPLTGAGKGVRFEDVAGLKEAKVEVMEFVDYLKNQHKYSKLGAKVPKGALLLGPPGCGKTLLAKAVATEANVPFLAMAGPEFVEMIGGVGAARVRDLFSEAKKRAPCIVYIDEIDAIGRKRSSGAFSRTTGEEEQTLNQLLVEMDGMAEREGVILLASTNRADVLDKALLRPGRFDRHILIDYPTLYERKEIFEQHLKGLKLEKLPTDYSHRLSQLTPGFSGADIANVCNEAALNAAKHTKKQVSAEDFEYAVERVIGGIEKKSHVMSPDERKVIAYHECGHALVGWLLKHTDALLKVTIVPRTSNVLGFAQYLPSDKRLYTKEELFDKMCMALGGRVAESLIFNRISSGAKDDLQKVTKMAYAQIREYGMDPVVGHLSFPNEEEGEAKGVLGKRPYSKKLTSIMDIQARQLVANAYKATEMVLTTNRQKLKLLAEQLLKSETLNYSDIEKLIGPPPFGKKKAIEALDLGPIPINGPSDTGGNNGNSGGSDDQNGNGANEERK